MPYIEPRACVVRYQEGGPGCRVTLILSRDPARPWSPASLYSVRELGQPIITLARLVRLDGIFDTFEADELPRRSLMSASSLVFASWWTADQLAIARAPDRPWRLIRFRGRTVFWRRRHSPTEDLPGGWEHELCRLCWAPIIQQKRAYFEGTEWLSAQCFGRYIATRNGLRLGDEV
jgi:hypothetical protein